MGVWEPSISAHEENLPARLRFTSNPEEDQLYKFFKSLMDALQTEPAIVANSCFGRGFELQYTDAFGSRLTTPQAEQRFIEAKLNEYITWARRMHGLLQLRLDALARRDELSNISRSFESKIVAMMQTIETLSRLAKGEWKEYAQNLKLERQVSPVRTARNVVSSLQPIQQTLASMAYRFTEDFKPAYKTFAKRNLQL